MNDIDKDVDSIIDNNSRFMDFSVSPDYSLNDDPEDEDISDCNILSHGFHIVQPLLAEDEVDINDIIEKPGHRFILKTNKN